jgi:Family of unknown function (DUF5691)
VTFAPLLEAALEGTLRRSPPAALPASDDDPAELRLLRGAAYEGIRRLAGHVPGVDDTAVQVDPCPTETSPAAPAASVRRLLEVMLNRRDLLPEWLELARARGVHLPPAVLADVLEHMRELPHLHALLPHVGGQRMAWLAMQNPAWSFVAPFDPLDRFQNGDVDERRRALRVLRSQDAAHARRLLTESWAVESAAARLTFLPILAECLSVEDEPLLERALHDRRKDVRQTALGLIRRLADSEFARRWSGRARAAVQFTSGRLAIREPHVVPAEWIADGLEPRAPRGVGGIAWTLTQLVAFAPPSIWNRDMLAHVLANDWAQPLIQGLSQAAASYADADWCEALLLAWTQAAARDQLWPIEPDRLLAGLPRERAERVLVQALHDTPRVTAGLLARRQVAWSEGFSRYVVQQLPRLVKQWEFAATAPLGEAGLRLDPAVLPQLIDVVASMTEPKWTLPVLERLVRTLSLRAAMRKELE